MSKKIILIISILISLLAGILGSLFTAPAIPTWYADLAKPELNPPNWVFGPVWTILYLLMGYSLYRFWTTESSGQKSTGFFAFVLQLVLNILWSAVFFGLHSPGLAVLVIVLLWVSIASTVYLFWKIDRTAAWLLVPYLGWVSFATYLNIMVAILN